MRLVRVSGGTVTGYLKNTTKRILVSEKILIITFGCTTWVGTNDVVLKEMETQIESPQTLYGMKVR